MCDHIFLLGGLVFCVGTKVVTYGRLAAGSSTRVFEGAVMGQTGWAAREACLWPTVQSVMLNLFLCVLNAIARATTAEGVPVFVLFSLSRLVSRSQGQG